MKLSVNVRGLDKELQRMSKTQERVQVAVMHAINRVADRTRTSITREAAKDYIIKVGTVREAIKVRKTDKTTMTAVITATGKNIELKEFRVKPMRVQHKGRRNKRLRVQVKKNSGAKELSRAFVAQLQGQSGLNVYERVGRERYIVNKLFGPSVPQMIKNESVLERIRRTAEDRLNQETNRQITRLLEK